MGDLDPADRVGLAMLAYTLIAAAFTVWCVRRAWKQSRTQVRSDFRAQDWDQVVGPSRFERSTWEAH